MKLPRPRNPHHEVQSASNLPGTMSSKFVCLRAARLAARHTPRRALATAAPRRDDAVRIVEVGPRDGLQNEKQSIPVATKIELVKRLAQTGLRTIEVGSFVSPKWVPQMANSDQLLEWVMRTPPESPQPITYQFLAPNVKGLDNFLAVWQGQGKSGQDAYPTPPPSPSGEEGSPALNTSSLDPNAIPGATSGADAMGQNRNQDSTSMPPIELSIFTAATETFTQKNTNCSIAESLKRFEPLITRSKDLGINVRAYISVALGCPYEGPSVDPHKVAEIAVSLLEMGADEISVGDTTGMGTAPKTRELLKVLFSAGIEKNDLALHFHDTYGQALVNSVVALEQGIRTFDASVGGLGGCPYSPGATGNVATEDLVHCFHSLGATTGVDIEKLAEVGGWISKELGRPNESRAGKATLARLRRSE